VIFITHYFLVMHNAWPFKKGMETRTDFISYQYAYPYFHQDYRLFVPPPQVNYELYVRAQSDNETIYTELFSEIKAGKSLFSGKEFMLLSLSAACHYVNSKETEITDGVYPFIKDSSFEVLNTVVKSSLYKLYSKNFSNITFVLKVTEIKNQHSKTLADA